VRILNKRSVSDAVDMLETAESVNIEMVRIDWPELRELIRLANRIPTSESLAVSVVEHQCISAFVVWVSQLADGPIKTLDQSAAYEPLVALLYDAISVGGPRTPIFQAELEIIESMGSHIHPAAPWLEDWISAQPISEGDPEGPRAGQPATALVSKREAGRNAVAKWLESENLFAEAVTYSALKHVPAYENLVLFGPPSRYETSKWSSSPESDYRAQWLLTSPPAARILMLSWPFHAKLDLSLMGPWQGVPPPTVVAHPVAVDVEVEPTLTFKVEPLVRRAKFNFDEEPDVVSASEYQILGDENGLWVFFDNDVGPRPRVLSQDLNYAHSHSGHKPLPAGSHLVFRSQDVERAQLLRVSQEWWTEKYSDYSFSRAEKLRNELKEMLRAFVDCNGTDKLRMELVSSGLSREYVQQIHSRILDQTYVAPQIQESYDAICRAIGYRPGLESFDLLGKLRTARQQAGILLMRQLLLKLQSVAAAGFREVLFDEGFASLQDDVLGELFITTVCHVSEQKTLFPISKLGRPVDTVGALWLK